MADVVQMLSTVDDLLLIKAKNRHHRVSITTQIMRYTPGTAKDGKPYVFLTCGVRPVEEKKALQTFELKAFTLNSVGEDEQPPKMVKSLQVGDVVTFQKLARMEQSRRSSTSSAASSTFKQPPEALGIEMKYVESTTMEVKVSVKDDNVYDFSMLKTQMENVTVICEIEEVAQKYRGKFLIMGRDHNENFIELIHDTEITVRQNETWKFIGDVKIEDGGFIKMQVKDFEYQK